MRLLTCSVRRRAAVAAVVAALLGASTWPARPLRGQQATFRSGIDVVQLDVVVLDDDRRPVRDLTEADFTVLEAGEPRPIVSFTPISIPTSVDRPAATPWPDVPADVVTNASTSGRLVVIMLDRMIPLGRPAMNAQRLARAIVDDLGPEDRAAVVHTVPLGRSQNFTANRDLLRAAVDSRAVGTSLSAGTFESGECYCQICSLEAIEAVADGLVDAGPQPKVLFFIGTGIPIGVADLLPTEGGIPEGIRPEDACYVPRTNATRSMFTAVQNANLVIHTISPDGLETASPARGRGGRGGLFVRSSQEIPRWPTTLLEVAGVTGGRAVLNDNDPFRRVPDLLAESEAYYLLGFTPAEIPTDGRLRPVEVRVNRPGVEVRTRRGFFAPEADDSPASDAPAMPAAIAAARPVAALPLTMSVVPLVPVGDDEVDVAVVLGLNLDDGVAARLADVETIPIRVMAFDNRGRERSSSVATLEARELESGLAHDLVVPLRVLPGQYEVRTAIELPDIAPSVFGYVDVPDLGDDNLTVSGVLLSALPGRPSHVVDALRPVLTVRPTSRRTFERSEQVQAELRVYSRRPGATVTAEIEAADGRGVVSVAVPLSVEEGRAPDWALARFDVPVADLAAGEYLLRLRASAGRDRREQAVRFKVE